MAEEPLGGQYNTSGMSGGVTSGITAINPVIGALYGIGSGLGEQARGDGTSGIGQGMSEIINPSHGFLTSLKSGNWKDAIPILGAIERKKRADKAKDEEENFDYTQTEAYKSAQQEQNLAYRQMQTGLPEQSMRFQEDMIGRSGAAALNTASGLRQGVGGLAQTANSLSQSYRGLAALDAQQRIANRGQYYDSTANMRQQEQYAANISYADYVNNQAKLLAQQSARAESKKNNQKSMMDAFGYLGNKAFTEKEFGGYGWGKGNKGHDFGKGTDYGMSGGASSPAGTNGGFGGGNFGSWFKGIFGGGNNNNIPNAADYGGIAN